MFDDDAVFVTPLLFTGLFIALGYGALHAVQSVFGVLGIYALCAGAVIAFVLQLRKVLKAEKKGTGWAMLLGALGVGLLPLVFLGLILGWAGASLDFSGPFALLLAAWFPVVLVVAWLVVEPRLERWRRG